MLFKKERRQNERKQELEEFLRSADGRRVMFELAPDILVSSKLTPILNDVRVQLEARTVSEITHFSAFVETTLKTAESHFSSKIDQRERDFARTCEAAETHFSSKIDQCKRDLAESLDAVEIHIAEFLRSPEGRRWTSNVLIAALAEGALTQVLHGAEERLKLLAKELVATHMANAELSLQRSAEAHAAAFKRRATEAACNLADQIAHDVQQTLRSYRATVCEAVQKQLPVLLREEVARHVGSGPIFSPSCSNRTLAAAHGISIREVKRRRRNGRL